MIWWILGAAYAAIGWWASFRFMVAFFLEDSPDGERITFAELVGAVVLATVSVVSVVLAIIALGWCIYEAFIDFDRFSSTQVTAFARKVTRL